MTRAERRRCEREQHRKGYPPVLDASTRPPALGVDWTLEGASRALEKGNHVRGDPERSLTNEQVERVLSEVRALVDDNRTTLARRAKGRLGLEPWQVEALATAITLPLCARLMRVGAPPPEYGVLATVLGQGPQLAEIVTDDRVLVAVTLESGVTLTVPGNSLHEFTSDIKAITPAAPAAAFVLVGGGWRGGTDGRPMFRTSVLAWDVRGLAVTAPGSAVDVLLRRAIEVGPAKARGTRAAILQEMQEDVRRDVVRDAVLGEITDPITLRVPLAGWIQRPGPGARSWFDTGASFSPWLFFRFLDALLGLELPLGFRRRPPVFGGDKGLLAMDDPTSLKPRPLRRRAGAIPVEDPMPTADIDAVRRQLARLPEKEREAVMHWLAADRAGLQLGPYCEEQELNYENVSRAYRRALEKLRGILRE